MSDGSIRAWGGTPARAPDRDEGIVVGALPFESSDRPELFAPGTVVRDEPSLWAPIDPASGRDVEIVAVPDRDGYTRIVESAVEALRAGADQPDGLRKVVLARRLDLVRETPIDAERLAARLSRDPHVTTFLLKTAGRASRTLVGASPELLLDKRGDRVSSMPLAGSAARRPDPAEDAEAGQRLLRSAKDQEEHRLVVEYVMDALAPLCTSLAGAPEPSLSRTHSMWHLSTSIEGKLRDPDMPSVTIARHLHPTPAVCGVPVRAASRFIREHEPFGRGLYGGAVGWSDGSRDGRWMVTLRCAEVDGRAASLYAGAGILPTSDPSAECEETSAKFHAMLSAFGITEDGERAGRAER